MALVLRLTINISNSNLQSHRTRRKVATDALSVSSCDCVGIVNLSRAVVDTGANSSRRIANLHSMDVQPRALSSDGRDIKSTPPQIDA